MRDILLALSVLLSMACHGQDFFISLGGIVTDHYTALPLSDVVVHVDVIGTGRRPSDVITKRDGSYRFKLERGVFYSVTYSKTGCVTKFIHIDATGVPARPDVPFYDMDVQMVLFEPIPDFDFSFFQQPIGRAEYKNSVRNLNWDNVYSQDKARELAFIMREYNKTYRGYYARTKTRPRIIISDSVLVLESDSAKDALMIDSLVMSYQPMDSVVSYYDDVNAAPATQVEAIRGAFFTVQVGVYSKPTPLDELFNITPLNSELMDNGNIRYTSGRFNSVDDANEYRKAVVLKGVKDAFVVAYFNGKKIPIEDALYLFAKFPKNIDAGQ